MAEKPKDFLEALMNARVEGTAIRLPAGTYIVSQPFVIRADGKVVRPEPDEDAA